MNETQRNARTAALLYLLLGITAPFALLYVPSTLYVRGNAAATAANIRSSEFLFRLGIVGGLLCDVIFIFLGVALYRLFNEISHTQAFLMVTLVVASASTAFLNRLNQIAALIVLSGADFLSVFSKPQLDALAMMFLRLHGHGLQAISMFWGLWLFPLGLLVVKSRFMPRILGVLLIINGVAYLLDSFTFFLLPQYVDFVSKLTILPKFGELLFMLWLLFKGVKAQSTGSPTPSDLPIGLPDVSRL